MAKTPTKNSYAKFPWEMKKEDVAAFIKVTETNRKQAIVIGRILYVITNDARKYIYGGCLTIDPCYFKGWWEWPILPFLPRDAAFKGKTHFRIMLDDKNRDEWSMEYKTILDNYILKEELYIKQSDPILTYIKQQ